MPALVKFSVCAALAALLLALPLAADTPQPVVQQPDETVVPTADTPAPTPREPSPMMRDIVAAWDAQELAVEVLEAQVAACTDPVAALALQRQIEGLRAQVEIQILTIQARYARQEGRLDVAAEIEAAVAEMTAPRPRGIPAERPVPDVDHR
jgi:hypothetical protein